MMTSNSWSMVRFGSVLAGILVASACSSDNKASNGSPSAGNDSGSGGATSGNGGKGGKGGIAGKAGAGGASGGATGTPDTGAGICTAAVSVTCDGPEDCPTGQRCCGEWSQQYIHFGCYDSCTAQQGDAGAAPGGGSMWFDLCHPGDTCENTTAQCLTSTYLPSSLSRCYTMGSPPDATLGKGKNEVNCGTAVCGASEQCCLRGTFEPYCAPSGATCDCAGAPAQPEAGTSDSGTPPAPEAGTDSGTPPVDAGTKG